MEGQHKADKNRRAKLGDAILLNFTEKLQNGTVVMSTKNSEPRKYTLGQNDFSRSIVIKIVGMEEGEKRSIELPPEKAYGQYDKNLIFKTDRKSFQDADKINIGNRYRIKLKNGKEFVVKVVNLDDKKVTLDANHKLAGKHIIYDIELLRILA